MRELRIMLLLPGSQLYIQNTCKDQGILKVNFEVLCVFAPLCDEWLL